MLDSLRGIHRILFLGDSITYAGGFIDEIDLYLYTHFPKHKPEVINLGLPSETLSGLSEEGHAGGAFPRPDLHERLERALQKIKPDLVVACYGMNDGIYYPFSEERFKKFQNGCLKLVTAIKSHHAKFRIVSPPPFDPIPLKGKTLPAGLRSYPSGSPYEGYDDVLRKYEDWEVDMTHRGGGWNVVELHSQLRALVDLKRKQTPEFTLSPDGVHPNELGHHLMAGSILASWGADYSETSVPDQTLLRLVRERQNILKDAWLNDVGHKRPGMNKGMPIDQAKDEAAKLDAQIKSAVRRAGRANLRNPFPGTRTGYHGFDRYDFVVDNCPATVVEPRMASAGKPWIWRAEFFDHRPETDLALLGKGFHLVYIQVGNSFGCPDAMKHWDLFYGELTRKYGLSKKPALEGLSRGGLYCYNWAAVHPKSVSCIYGDAPVCDFKSWPGGKGKGKGSAEDWAKLIKDYHFASEAEALAYAKNRVDNLKSLAKARVPLLHVYGDADDVVPYEENTAVIKQRYEKLGGKIQLIVKPGVGHHPHGLDDPAPIVEFILRNTKTR